MTSFFQQIIEWGRAIHFLTFLKAVFTVALVFYFAAADYSFWIGFALFAFIFVFLELIGVQSRRLTGSAAVFVFCVFAIVWNLSPGAYGVLSYVLLFFVFVTGFYLLYALSRFELSNESRGRLLYYTCLSLAVFLSMFAATTYHFFFSFFLGLFATYILAREEFSVLDLSAGQNRFAAASASFVMLELYFSLRMLPVNFLLASALMAFIFLLVRKGVVVFCSGQNLSFDYLVRQVIWLAAFTGLTLFLAMRYLSA